MPRIPQYDAAGVTTARATTPRFPAERSDAIEREGQEAALGAVGQVVGQAVEHDDKLRYAAARISLLQAQAAARKELEEDDKPETFEKRYLEATAKARSEAAAKIRGGRSRELFEADAQADIERGVEQIRGLARGVETRQGVASLNESLEASRTLALESKNEAERIAYLESANDAIDGALARRYIDEEQARAVRSKYTQDFSEAYIGIQTPAERIAMLSEPEKSFAKFIAPDRRAALLEAAKKDNDEVRVRAESQAYFDQVMAENGTDFRAAFNQARAELKDDPLVRDAVESRISQEQIRVETFEREDSEDAGEQGMQFLIGGGNFADMPLSIKNRLKPSTLIALKNFSQSRGRTESDPETLVKLSELASDPQNFADNVRMMDYRPLLTDADFQQGLDLQRKIRTGSVDGKASGYLSINQVRNAKLIELFGGTSSKKKDTQVEINSFVTKFEAEQRAFKEQNGKAPSTDDARKILDQMSAEVVTKEGFFGFGGAKKPAYKVTEEDVQVPAADRAAIIEVLRESGKPVTAKEIERVYSGNRAKRNAPTSTPISDAIRAAEEARKAKSP